MRKSLIGFAVLAVTCLAACDKLPKPPPAPPQTSATSASEEKPLPSAVYSSSSDEAAVSAAPTAARRNGQLLTLFNGRTEIASFDNATTYCGEGCSTWDFVKPLMLAEPLSGARRYYYLIQETAFEYQGEVLVDLKGHVYDLDGTDATPSSDGRWLAAGNLDEMSDHVFSITDMASPQKNRVVFDAECMPLKWENATQLNIVCTYPQVFLAEVRRKPDGKWRLTPTASAASTDVWDKNGNLVLDRFNLPAGPNNVLAAIDGKPGTAISAQDASLTTRGYQRLINDDGTPADREMALLAAFPDLAKRGPKGLTLSWQGKSTGRLKNSEEISYFFEGPIGNADAADAPLALIQISADEINDSLVVDRNGWLFDVGPSPLMSWDGKYLATGFYSIFSSPGFFITDWNSKARVVFDADCTPERWEDSTNLLALCDAVQPNAGISHMRVRVTRSAKSDWTMTEIQALTNDDTAISKVAFTPVVRRSKPAAALKPSTEWDYTRLAKP